MSGTSGALPEARTAGTDGRAYGQLAAARQAARHLLDCGALESAEHDTLTRVVQRISAAIDARPVDLDGAHQRWPGWRFSREGEELVARSTDGLCTLRSDSPEALEAKVRREEQMWTSVRDFAANPAWRTPVTERAGPGARDTVRTRSCTARRATGRSTRAGTLVLP